MVNFDTFWDIKAFNIETSKELLNESFDDFTVYFANYFTK